MPRSGKGEPQRRVSEPEALVVVDRGTISVRSVCLRLHIANGPRCCEDCREVSMAMLDRLRIVIARFVVHRLPRPRPLVVAGWLWQAAQTDDIEEERRCLWAVLELHPDNTRALLGVLALVLDEGDDWGLPREPLRVMPVSTRIPLRLRCGSE